MIFFMTWNLAKAGGLWTHPWRENPGYTSPPARAVYQVSEDLNW